MTRGFVTKDEATFRTNSEVKILLHRTHHTAKNPRHASLSPLVCSAAGDRDDRTEEKPGRSELPLWSLRPA